MVGVVIQSRLNCNFGEHNTDMRTLYSGLFFVLLGFTTQLHAWSLAKDKEGVRVFTKDSSFSGFKMFRGEVRVNADLDRALTFLQDAKLATTWLHDCIESRVLASTSAEHYTVYQVIKAPWPVDDRDYVLDIRITRAKTAKKAVIEVRGLDRPDLVPLKQKRVRVTELNGTWTLTQIAENSVEITYQTEANPTGKIPAWLANAFVVDQPFSTLLNLKQHFAALQ
ncbi:hypothetical protein A3758_13605 [Oleiphilus sp. HI0118]|nr:hypothetical protein A3758_20795 [Oleiphilus sp. HI0118]KZZ49882.1 hypothetical protein A3758_13605 [Oleiphilus sp. HI0118]